MAEDPTKSAAAVKLLVSALKHVEGKLNFEGFAKDIGAGNAEAARKRLRRFLERENISLAIKGNLIGDITALDAPVSNPYPTGAQRAKNTTAVANAETESHAAKGRKRKVVDEEEGPEDTNVKIKVEEDEENGFGLGIGFNFGSRGDNSNAADGANVTAPAKKISLGPRRPTKTTRRRAKVEDTDNGAGGAGGGADFADVKKDGADEENKKKDDGQVNAEPENDIGGYGANDNANTEEQATDAQAVQGTVSEDSFKQASFDFNDV